MREYEKPLYSKVTLAGHPVHPMLVSFPVAFYTATFVGFVIFVTTRDPFWFRAAYVANVAGVAMALMAAIPGFVDWWKGIPDGSRAKADGITHMLLNVSALLLFVVNLVASAIGWNEPVPNAVPALVLSFLGVLLTVCAGWFGWRMVQTHHVGVQMPPVTPVDHRPHEEHRTRVAV
jgi:uncharacterized membrane protein